jgi:recombination protein RecA
VELEIIKKSGSWFSYDGNKLGQGRDGVKNILQDNPELMNEIEAKIRAKIKSGQGVIAEERIPAGVKSPVENFEDEV